MTTRVGPKRIRPRPAPFETNRIDFDTARNHCLANYRDIEIRRRLGAVAFVRVFYVPTTELSSLDRFRIKVPDNDCRLLPSRSIIPNDRQVRSPNLRSWAIGSLIPSRGWQESDYSISPHQSDLTFGQNYLIEDIALQKTFIPIGRE